MSHHYHHPFTEPKRIRPIRVVMAVVAGISLATVIGLAIGILVKFLWNTAVAAPFSLPTITYWQAVGMFILAKIMFSIGHHGHSHNRHDHHRDMHQWFGADCGKTHDAEEHGERFRLFWQEEGREAFEAYCRKSDGESDHA